MGNFITTTNPSPAVSTQSFTFILTDVDDMALFNALNTYNLLIDGTNFTDFEVISSTELRFNNVISTTSGNVPYVVTDETDNHSFENNVLIDPVCYMEGTEILCFVDNEEKYINIENLTPNMLVKTYKQGYTPIYGISNAKHLSTNRQGDIHAIHKLKKDALSINKPFKDFYVTGGHSILVNKINDKTQYNYLSQTFGGELRMKIEDKFKLLVPMCDLFEVPVINKVVNIYQIALNNENILSHYGIYANGILSESMNINNYNNFEKAKNTKLKHFNQINIVKV